MREHWTRAQSAFWLRAGREVTHYYSMACVLPMLMDTWKPRPTNVVHLVVMSTTAAASRSIAVSESLRRREAAQSALTDLRLEGLAPSDDARRDVEQFVRGELTEEQLLSTIVAR
jgi:hypothetical protein